MSWHFYLRKGNLYIPTVARTEAGFYLDIEPVAVIAASDARALNDAARAAILRKNTVISTPTRASFPKPVVLKYANVKSWSAFERSALNWTILEKDGVYQIKPGRRGQNGGWEDDTDKREVFPPGSSVDEVARRFTGLVQSALV